MSGILMSHMATAGFPRDPYLSNVTLLLPMNGTNGSTTFTDFSLNPKIVTANGNAQISTTQWKFGGASSLFDGTGDCLSTPDSADFEFGSGNFTMECWIYPTTVNSPYATVIGKWTTSGNRSYLVTINSGPPNTITVYLNESLAYSTTNSVTLNSWNHIAIVRSGDTFSTYINGVLGGTPYTNAITLVAGSASFFIGANQDTGSPLRFYTGYIDDLRITKGIARYTTNFTPPSSAFPNK